MRTKGVLLVADNNNKPCGRGRQCYPISLSISDIVIGDPKQALGSEADACMFAHIGL
jgi:hypothetical protein